MRFFTAGNSHGSGIFAFIDGFPANIEIDDALLEYDLQRRQSGYGRGGRQKIEQDKADFHSGVFKGKTTGAPIVAIIRNKDFSIDKMPSVFCPRPGHADLSGIQKFHLSDIRPVLERASARETAGRVVAGSLAKMLLRELGIEAVAFVRSIGNVEMDDGVILGKSLRDVKMMTNLSEVFCPDPDASENMIRHIDEAKEKQDTLGGVVEVRISGLSPGIGSFTQWDERLDGRIAQAVMSVQAIKWIEIGSAIENTKHFGSRIHDEIVLEDGFARRKTNRAGGIEGGMSNGEDIVIRAGMKPIATIGRPLKSIDIRTGEGAEALVERFDTCAVSAASVVVEAMACWVIADAITKKFGCDDIASIKTAFNSYKTSLNFKKEGNDEQKNS